MYTHLYWAICVDDVQLLFWDERHQQDQCSKHHQPWRCVMLWPHYCMSDHAAESAMGDAVWYTNVMPDSDVTGSWLWYLLPFVSELPSCELPYWHPWLVCIFWQCYTVMTILLDYNHVNNTVLSRHTCKDQCPKASLTAGMHMCTPLYCLCRTCYEGCMFVCKGVLSYFKF